MEGTIITLIFTILVIVAHIIKAIRERAEAVKQPPPDPDEEELVIVTRPKPGKQSKQPKMTKQRSLTRQPLGERLEILDDWDIQPSQRQALSKKLSPQGEGQRFDADPGTLDTARVLAPTIDSTVKPELESITGIYEEGVMFAEGSKPAITLNIADYLAKPEGIVHAVILSEILNRPAWQKTP
jgi:hypothetical protein